MTAIAFDTHETHKRLVANGFSSQQAEVLIATIRDVDTSQIATRHDIQAVKQDLKELELSIIIKIGGMIMALGAILISIKYFH